MAMPIGDASDINTLLHWIKGDRERWPGGPKISAEQTLEAGRRLAGKAYKALSAGFTPAKVAVEMGPSYAPDSMLGRWAADDLEALIIAAGEHWHSSPRDPWDVLSERQKKLLGRAAGEYRKRGEAPVQADSSISPAEEFRCSRCHHLHDEEFVCELDCVTCAVADHAKQEKEDTEDDDATPEACEI